MSQYEASIRLPIAFDEARRKEFWAALALRHTSGIGAKTWGKLLAVYGCAYAAVLDVAQWTNKAKISKRLVDAFGTEKWREPAKKEWDAAFTSTYSVLLWTDERYPTRLKEIPNPPLFLYFEGDITLLSNPGVAVVGSRLCSREGRRITRDLCRHFAVSGITTVSGLAKGIDAEAHSSALEGIGSTIAVLGAGLDHIYPPDNTELHTNVQNHGLLLSEFAPFVAPEPRNFPQRNRIISGLSLGVVVVEAAARSGSLITAQFGLEQGREVFAVPGPEKSPTSKGCHSLILQGAKPVFTCDDVLVDLAPLIGINAEEWKLGAMGTSVSVPDTPDFSVEATDSCDSEKRSMGTMAGAVGSTLIASTLSSDTENSTLPVNKTSLDESVTEEPHGAVSSSSDNLCQSACPDEAAVLTALKAVDSIHIDELSRSLGWDSSKMSSVLLMLEIDGSVRQLPGMNYVLA